MDLAVYHWVLGLRSDTLTNFAITWSTLWAPGCVWVYAALLGFVTPSRCHALASPQWGDVNKAHPKVHPRVGSLVQGLLRVVPLVSVLAASACSSILKRLVGRARPPESTRLMLETNPAFPSGHAVAAAALAAAAFFFLRSRMLAAVLGINALVVGFTRLYVRVHWLSDVLAGLALGIIVVWVVFRVVRHLIGLYYNSR